MSAASRTVLDRPAPPPSYSVSYGDLPDHVADVWVPTHGEPAPVVVTSERIGVAYAGEPWASRPWRFAERGHRSVSGRA